MLSTIPDLSQIANDRPSGPKNWIECWFWKLWVCYNRLWLRSAYSCVLQ